MTIISPSVPVSLAPKVGLYDSYTANGRKVVRSSASPQSVRSGWYRSDSVELRTFPSRQLNRLSVPPDSQAAVGLQ